MKLDTEFDVRNTGRLRTASIWRGIRLAAVPMVFGLVLLVAGSCSRRLVGAQDTVGTFSKHLDDRVPGLMKQYSVPGVSIALVRGGQVVWSGAYGYADLEQNRKMTADSVFRVESISKSLTAWGVMKLVEQGLVDLDVPVQQYLGEWVLPESEFAEQEITVRRLLSHNAGMPLGTIGVQYPPQSEIPSLRDHLTQEARMIKEPGSGFLYANTGFNLLELLIEAVTGRDYAEYMANEVLLPLGMNNSSFVWNESFNPAIPTGYDLKGNLVPLYVYPSKASGGLFAPVEDIARFVSAGVIGPYAMDQSVLSEESIRLIHTAEVDIPGVYGVVSDTYGFGHFIETLSDGRQAVWHGGQGNGWMSHFHLVPESGDGIIILTNSQRSWPLIAEVLSDWAKWSGFKSVKMGKISYGISAMWTLIGMVVLASLWMVYRLVGGLRDGTRKFAPLSSISFKSRLLQVVLGNGVIAALAWSAAQPYLIVSSIFPGVSEWAGSSFLVMSVVMIVSALFPRFED